MRSATTRLRAVLGAFVVVTLALGAATAGANRPLVTAVVDPDAFRGLDRGIAFKHVQAAGATVVRLVLDWAAVAPRRLSGDFHARDAMDSGYQFDAFDAEVQAAVAAGLQPLINVVGAPSWAQTNAPKQRAGDGPDRPRPRALADFATAVATRYSGTLGGLPRVRYWQVWNEPNLSSYLVPQQAHGRAFSPGWYRAMVNAMADAVHAVNRTNFVVAGGLAPFGPHNPSLVGTAPFRFMRQFLCISPGPRPRPTCRATVRMDAWSIHPYTSGGPTHAAGGDDASAGDLGRMNHLLRAAERAGHIVARNRVQFWVTEFSWDTDPPDPDGLPLKLQARWISQVLYEMWRQGVDLVTWNLIRDQPLTPSTPAQSGLYLRGPGGVATDRPKPALRAFRFPFVALRSTGNNVSYWGRTPRGVRKTVVIDERTTTGWSRVAKLQADLHGIFSGRIRDLATSASPTVFRARLVDGTDASLPFWSGTEPDRRVCPFGTC